MLTVDDLRAYIRDNAAFNKLFLEKEFENTELQSAIDWAGKSTLGIEPFIDSFNYGTVPDVIMLDGALWRLFDSAAAGELRNQSNLAEQNIPVPVGENGLIYERLAEKYKLRFQSAINKFKLAVNFDNAMTGNLSPYRTDGWD